MEDDENIKECKERAIKVVEERNLPYKDLNCLEPIKSRPCYLAEIILDYNESIPFKEDTHIYVPFKFED